MQTYLSKEHVAAIETGCPVSALGSEMPRQSPEVRRAATLRIKEMIDAENKDAVLSDDQIVERLRAFGIDIARRTVAKYRESLRIPSSVERRRIFASGG